jgi:hypothetical protein
VCETFRPGGSGGGDGGGGGDDLGVGDDSLHHCIIDSVAVNCILHNNITYVFVIILFADSHYSTRKSN